MDADVELDAEAQREAEVEKDGLLVLLREIVSVAERDRVGVPDVLGDPDCDGEVEDETQLLPVALSEDALPLLSSDGLATLLACDEVVREGENDAEAHSDPKTVALGLTLTKLCVGVADGEPDVDAQREAGAETDALRVLLRDTVSVAERDCEGVPDALGEPDCDGTADDEGALLVALGEGASLPLTSDGLAEPLALSAVVGEGDIEAEAQSDPKAEALGLPLRMLGDAVPVALTEGRVEEELHWELAQLTDTASL